MARALLLFERQADASWLPTTVILATPKRLQGKCLPGSPDRNARLHRIVNTPCRRGPTTRPGSAGPEATGSVGASTLSPTGTPRG